MTYLFLLNSELLSKVGLLLLISVVAFQAGYVLKNHQIKKQQNTITHLENEIQQLHEEILIHQKNFQLNISNTDNCRKA